MGHSNKSCCHSGSCDSVDVAQGFTKDIEKGAKLWFYAAGAFAIILAFCLFKTDEMLSHSPRDKILGETLLELRTAQTSLTTDPTDTRITGK